MPTHRLSRFYNRKHILITGGLGFIGSNLAIKLVALGARVTIIDNLSPGLGGNRFNIEPVKDKVRLVLSDLRDLRNLRIALKNQSIIFNLAGTHSHIDSMKNPINDLALTCETQLAFLEICRKYNQKVKIIMAGTRNQYGKPLYLPVDEGHPCNPLDINGAHWLAVENYHLLYFRVYGLRTCSLRLTNTYGPRHQMKHPYQGILNWFIRLIISGKAVKLYDNGKQKRDITFVDDVVDAFLLSGASDTVWGKVYNLGGACISLKQFVKEAVRIHGKGKLTSVPFPAEARRIEPGDYQADWKKIKTNLGWEPKTTLQEGLKKTIEYYKKWNKYYW